MTFCLHRDVSLKYINGFKGWPFRKGVAVDRLIGFIDMGGKDDFSTRAVEVVLIKKGNALSSVCLQFFACGKVSKL